MVRLCIQVSGSSLIVGLEGKKESIYREFLSFMNHGATTAAHFLSDRFLYFWTNHEDLTSAVEKKIENIFYNKTGIEFNSKEFKSRLHSAALAYIADIRRETFLHPNKPTEEYGVKYEPNIEGPERYGIPDTMPSPEEVEGE